MPNMSNEKTKMPQQAPDIRNKNFSEVALGYDKKMAMEEAERCLNCKNKPCMNGCPVNVKIPEFIDLVKKGDFEGAYYKIKETSSLPAVCGRVCPQESQCEKYCVRGIKGESVAIGRLERFVADYFMENCKEKQPEIVKKGKKVAVIGAGPASLACAGDLAKAGYDVTIFEAFHKAGGVLVYGIPEFRLPKNIVQAEIDKLKTLDVKIELDTVVGKTIEISELFDDGFEAVFIGTGAGLPSFMNIKGESLNGVYSANEFLTRVNLMKAYKFPEYDTPVYLGKNVAVVGGGNVAMDAARCAKRLGAEKVFIIYRRGEDEMPARLEEIEHAKEEGIIFNLLTNPVEIVGDENGWVTGIKCIKMQLGEPDKSGRRRPVPIKDSEFEIKLQNVIIAIGQTPNPLIKQTTKGLETYEWGGIIADEETGRTSIDGVYAGGDAVTGAATVILAMGAGKKAAKAIDEYLS
ncbi:MAG: NADPH-dependent glutamate synthase [Clostridia bacterium]|nr:NADPH-dependent glutamate synthase [Clostridia bacterium]